MKNYYSTPIWTRNTAQTFSKVSDHLQNCRSINQVVIKLDLNIGNDTTELWYWGKSSSISDKSILFSQNYGWTSQASLWWRRGNSTGEVSARVHRAKCTGATCHALLTERALCRGNTSQWASETAFFDGKNTVEFFKIFLLHELWWFIKKLVLF